MAQDLKSRLRDCEVDGVSELQDIADEMFTRYVNAQVELGEYKARCVVLMQEIQRLEEENGRLRTELDNAQKKMAAARDEREGCATSVKNLLCAVEKLKEENRVLSEENYKMETQIRQTVEGMAVNRVSTADVARCPKCGSMDVATNGFGRKGLCACNVCAEVFEVEDNG